MAGPAQQPDNEFTQMIQRVGMHNRGTGRVEGPVTAGSQPNVRSAAYGVQPEAPLSVEERMELDRLAREAGVMDAGEAEEGQYPSRAEAEAIGAPVAPPREELDAKDVIVVPGNFTRPGRIIPVAGYPGAVVTPTQFPKLPDFSKPGVLDLIRGVIYLDGLEFPIPEADLAEFRAYVVTAVASDIQRRLNAALAQYAPKEAADGGDARDEDVQQVQEDEEPGSVQPSVETV